ncbi:MAG: glutamate-5-semialdehyde dehydrogenase [Elusimicrobia bacterium CG03_land_8_20_14_0_80_50_18]|nr:MAG: glutamate-5-semialdehyde dehydrogenase [Elusimicrobia bacterium CG03_land_8_20_14_0_80_50_18]
MNQTDYREIFRRMRRQGRILERMKDSDINSMLRKIARNIIGCESKIIAANKKDISRALFSGKDAAFIDRLSLDRKRIRAMASQVVDLSRLPSPLGRVLSVRKRPNGLNIRKVSVPLGTLMVIYESRPNVTSDVAALCLKSGNAVILRGGSDAVKSNRAVYDAVMTAVPAEIKDAVFFVEDSSRRTVDSLLKMNGLIDAVIPRGGEGLINAVVKKSRIPVIYHGKGVCNLYVHKDADMKMAVDIALNAKVSRPGVCNAIENLLVHKDAAKKFLPMIHRVYASNGVEMRGCPETRKILPDIKAASPADWDTEYLAKIISIKVVSGIDDACEFINTHGSGHSEAIVASGKNAAKTFFSAVDAACLYHNASTRFTDGGEFGMGAEIGISNQKLHPRGPVGLEELTSYKYIISGSGQIRK